MIDVQRVTKRFGDVVALSDVSLQVGAGLTSVLGPNGSGKSTLIRLICGLVTPNVGTVRVLGRPPRGDPSLYRRIGLVPESDAILRTLTGVGFVRFGAELHGLDEPDAAARRAIQTVDLDADDPRPMSAYSKGMRQRAKIARAIVHDPELLVLDEPLNGLDPIQRAHTIELFGRLAGEGRCLLVSSHVLEDVERLGSRVLVLVRGRLLAEGDFHQIRDLLDERPHRLLVRCGDARTLAARLVSGGVVSGVRVQDLQTLLVDASDVRVFRRRVAGVARDADVRLEEITPLDDDLESVFRYLMARAR